MKKSSTNVCEGLNKLNEKCILKKRLGFRESNLKSEKLWQM